MSDENSDETTKLRNVDEGLNHLILRKYEDAITYYSEQRYEQCYSLLKSLFFLIQPYEFGRKEELQEVIEFIEDYKNSNQDARLNKASIIQMGKKQAKFSLLVDELYRELPKSFAELGKWFNIVKTYNDFDEMLTKEMFNNEDSFLQAKKEDLIKLSSEELIGLLNANHVHHAHSRYLVRRGIENVKN